MNIGNALNMQMNAAAQNEGLKRSPLESRPADRPQEAAKAAPSEKRFADVINEKTNSSKTAKAEPSEENQNKKKTKAATQEDAMNVFLARMQEELGVDSEKILEAFSEMSAGQLSAPPEESAESFIQKLNLNPQESSKALGMYQQMLAMTAATGLSNYLENNGQQAELQVLGKKEADLMELRHSIGDMSDRFFMTGMHSPKTGLDQQSKIAQAYQQKMGAAQAHAFRSSEMPVNSEVQNTDLQKEGFILDPKDGWQFDTNMQDGALDMNSNAAMAKAAAAAGAATATTVTNDGSEFIDAASQLAPDAQNQTQSALLKSEINPDMSQYAQVDAPPVGAEKVLNSYSSQAPQPSMDTSLGLAGTKDAMMSGDDATDESKEDGLSEGDLTNPLGQPSQAMKSQTKSFIMNAPQATPADVQTNVKEIISQAQFLSSKGGGEMKVSLNPDGLGQVSLKVRMENGQVNVEMVASSEEAKKVLEKGLGELKDSLATHKLHLDSIKIDSSKDISNQLADQQRDLDHGQQQKFLNDFKERNQGWKREMFEFGPAIMPKSQTRDEAANALYASSTKKRDVSRRLDLVA